MHESDSFITEVSEEVRRDRLYATLRRYRWLLAAVVLLIVGGAAVNSWYQARQRAAAAAAGGALQRGARRARRGEARRGARRLRRGDAAGGGAGAAGAGRQPRGARAIATAPPRCSASWPGMASVEPICRSLAALERVMLLGAAMDASERQATLEGLAAPEARRSGRWRSSSGR